MAQWGNTDDAANSVLWAVSQVKLTANSTNRDNLFGNTTQDAFITGATVGQFGMDTTEVGVSNGVVISATITSPGSGYTANATITVDGSATANSTANATGRIATVTITDGASGYSTPPAITIAAPTSITFNSNTALFETASGIDANTDVDDTAEFISISSNPFSNGDALLYSVATDNTAIGGLSDNTVYYAVYANDSGLALSATSGGANIDLTKGPTETGHSLRREDGFIEIASNILQDGDLVTYTTDSGNTAIAELTSGSQYYVVSSNSTGVRLATTAGGTTLDLTAGVSETGHSLTGETATASAVISGPQGAAHAGWVLRTVGTGGRSGRVQYETLVAMGSLSGDDEDTILPDA